VKLNLYGNIFQVTMHQPMKTTLKLVSFELFFFDPPIIALNLVLNFLCDLELDDEEDNDPLYEIIDRDGKVEEPKSGSTSSSLEEVISWPC